MSILSFNMGSQFMVIQAMTTIYLQLVYRIKGKMHSAQTLIMSVIEEEKTQKVITLILLTAFNSEMNLFTIYITEIS